MKGFLIAALMTAYVVPVAHAQIAPRNNYIGRVAAPAHDPAAPATEAVVMPIPASPPPASPQAKPVAKHPATSAKTVHLPDAACLTRCDQKYSAMDTITAEWDRDFAKEQAAALTGTAQEQAEKKKALDEKQTKHAAEKQKMQAQAASRKAFLINACRKSCH